MFFYRILSFHHQKISLLILFPVDLIPFLLFPGNISKDLLTMKKFGDKHKNFCHSDQGPLNRKKEKFQTLLSCI